MMFEGTFAGEPRSHHRGVVVRKKAPNSNPLGTINSAPTPTPVPLNEPTAGFYYAPDREVVKAGGFHNVRIFMTDKGGSGRKWSDTKMIGILKLVMVQDVGAPIVNVRLCGTDPAGAERGIILEYELPTNFSSDGNLTPTFSAIQIPSGEFLGFLFMNESDKNAFNDELNKLKNTLKLTT